MEDVQVTIAIGAILVMLILRLFRLQDLRVLFIFLATYLSLVYFVWRITQTLSYHGPVSFVFALLLLAAELYGFIVFGLSNFVNIKPEHRQHVPLPPNEREWPTVDVFIPTFNEDLAIVETTALAALQIDYPKDKLTVYILDDGGTDERLRHPDTKIAATAQRRRRELSELCLHYGIVYLAREKNVRAKAGNLNAGLQYSTGNLILILDADHVPTRDILKNTVGLFVEDSKLFLVQTPHFFANPDPIEKNLRTFRQMPGENEMFYNGVQRGLDRWNGAYFCGSAAILRRRCVEECGGFSGDSITEDAETALTMHAAGYRSAYVGRPMVCGLACESIPAFLQQRCRWGTGMMQIFLLKNPLFMRGLALPQRLCYMSSCFFWFFPFSRIIFMIAPLLFLLFGLKIYDTTASQFLIFAIPHLCGVLLLNHFLFGKLRWSFIGDIYEIVQSIPLFPVLIGTLLKPRAPIFKVTAKGELLKEDHLSGFARPYVVLFLINLIAFIVGIFRIFSSETLSASAATITMIWSSLNCLFLLACIGVMLERRQLRGFPRLPASDSLRLHHKGKIYHGHLFDLSNTGAGIRLILNSIRQLPEFDGESVLEIRDCTGELLRLNGSVHNGRLMQEGLEIGFNFRPKTDAEKLSKIRLVYGDSERWVRFQRSRHNNRGILSSLFFILRVGGLSALEYFSHWMLKILHVAPKKPILDLKVHREVSDGDILRSTQRVFRAEMEEDLPAAPASDPPPRELPANNQRSRRYRWLKLAESSRFQRIFQAEAAAGGAETRAAEPASASPPLREVPERKHRTRRYRWLELAENSNR